VRTFRFIPLALILGAMLLTLAGTASANDSLESVIDVQKYNRSIHIMAMLLVGFGFLMVFVKKYGR
jgi:ammonium transporter Rh